VTVAILILGFFLRVVNLNQSFWLDEASQAVQSSRSIGYIWFQRSADFHPPLFYFLAHVWMQFGRSEIWLRLLPISFAVANIYVIYILAEKLFPNQSLKISEIAAFFIAISPFHIYYSQEFRSYSLLCLLATLAIYFIYQKRFFWLAVINALLFYTHYSAFFLYIAQLAYLLFYDRNNFKKFMIHNLLFIILILPWLPQFLKQLQSGTNIDTYFPGWQEVLSISPLKAFPTVIFKLVAGRISFLSRWLYGAYIIFVFTVTFFGLFIARHRHANLYLWVFVPIFSMLAISFWLPQTQPFRVIYVLPPLLLLFSSAALRFPKLIITLLIYISIVGNLAYFTRPRLQREQWRQAAIFLQSQAGVVIIKFPGNFAPLDWYAPNLEVIAAVPTMPAKPEEVSLKLSGLINHDTVFLLEYLTDLTDPQRLVDLNLKNQGFKLSRTYDFPGVGFIYKYIKS